MRKHIPKRHLDWDNPVVNTQKMDSTTDRIYGVLDPQPMISESYAIGKGTNPADNLAKFGKKTLAMEQAVSKYWQLYSKFKFRFETRLLKK